MVVGQTISHFRIVDKIGEGGMGVVYRAEDLDLGRPVALKVLHTEFVTDDERRKRFMREARTAAAVTHPNIATVHEIGEHEGVIFIAMELVEGRTLKRVIGERELEIDGCLRLAIEIGEGLGRAHQAGIVHRDLKPENIVIDTDGRVKILDFGLAKLYEDPTGKPADDSSALQTISAAVTRDGRILGTVQYMSPEQARGVELDSRSDVFSVGVVLYEMITRQNPFRGETITDTLTAILRDEQPPIVRFNPQVPVELERIITRCLEKDPRKRYPNAGELLADLRELKHTSDSHSVPLVSDPGLARRRIARLPWKRIAGLGAVAVLLVALGAAAAALLRDAGWLPGAASTRASLAVLPFENLQERDDPERLGQILQELIITDLSELESLKVLSSQRLFDVQKQLGRASVSTIDRDIATQVARQAGADVMLTGSLSRLGSTWILTCQLIDLEDGTVVKSERIDGADIYGMVDDLTSVVRGDLGVGQDTDLAVTQRTTSSLEAYQHYLYGVDALNGLNFGLAIDQFEKAVEIDPSFGKAYYKLAIARWWLGSLDGYDAGGHAGSPGEALEQLLTGDVKLSRKDHLMAEAFLALVQMRPVEAAPMFEEIVRRYPDEKEAWYGLGEARYHGAPATGERLAALEPFEKACELDPSFSLAFYHIVDLYIQQKRFDEGIARVRGFIDQEPDNLSWYQDWARLEVAGGDKSRIEAAVDESLRRIDGRADQRLFLLGTAKAVGSRDLDLRASLLQRAAAVETTAFQGRVLVDLGEVATAKREFDRAESYLREALGLDAQDPATLNALFSAYDASRRFDEALREAERLMHLDPDFAPYYGYWAAAAIQKGDPEQSRAALGRVRELLAGDPGGDPARIAIGGRVVKACFRVGNLVAAEALLREGLEIADPSTRGSIQTSLGWATLEQDRPQEASEWFARGLESSLNKEQPLMGLMRTSVLLGRPEDAIRYAGELEKLQPGAGWARARLIEAHLRTGDESTAAKLEARSLEEIDDERERRSLTLELGRTYLAAGRFADAERLAREAGSSVGDPGDTQAEELLAWSLMGQERPSEAEQVLDAGIETNPESDELRVLGAFDALLADDAPSAERQAGDLLSHGPALAEAHVAMAYALGRQGRFDEARAHAEQALAMNPDRIHRTLMSWVLIAGKLDADRGLELAVRAVETPESYSAAARKLTFLALPEQLLGTAYLERGRYAEAVEQLTEASRLRPDHPGILEQLRRATRLSADSGS